VLFVKYILYSFSKSALLISSAGFTVYFINEIKKFITPEAVNNNDSPEIIRKSLHGCSPSAFLKSNNVTVTALGYYPGKTIPDKFLLHSNINFFSNNDLNWYYKPKNTSLNKFINQKIDLFFDLSINNYFPVDFVSLLSNASFKVGMEKKDNVDFDLMINIDKNKTIPYLIEQIKHYLMLINKS